MQTFDTQKLEALLLAYIKDKYLPDRFRRSQLSLPFGEKDVRFFAMGAAQLSQAFTSGRGSLPKNYFNKKECRSAYLLYFTLTNFVKVIKCLDEAFRLADFPKGLTELQILDLGCGPGTASLACSSYFENRLQGVRLSITAIDQNREILNDAKALFSSIGNPRHTLHMVHHTILPRSIRPSLRGKKFDLIIASNILNEIGTTREQASLCQMLIDHHLSQSGVLIIVDPALQKTARALMEVRDLLNAFILSPCLHERPCPMRAYNRRDWCHFYLEWHCPEIIRKIDRLLGIKHDYLKLAYLILRQTPHPLPARGRGKCGEAPDLWRVVSSPLKSKGKCEFVLCGAGRLNRILRLDYDRSDLNRAFDCIKRGDIIKVAEGLNRITKNKSPEILIPFNNP